LHPTRRLYGVTGDPRNNTTDAYPPYDPGLGANNLLGTRLFGWDDCGSNKRKAINDAYYDFSVIAEADGIYQNIDFNFTAALELLGPPVCLTVMLATNLSVSNYSWPLLGISDAC
jgi:hypothetical protein